MNHVLLFGMPGGGELFVIVLVIIMLFGSKKIPELARGLGKGIREIKNATNEIQREIREGAKDMGIPSNPLDIKKQVENMINNDPDVKVKPETSISETETKTELASSTKLNSKPETQN